MIGTSKIEKLFVERGCSDLQHIYSLPQNCSGNVCDVTLDEENYGNFGKIKAKYSTKESLVKFSDARPDWNTNFGLRCIQCQSKPGALVTEKVFYLLVKPGVGTKKKFGLNPEHIFLQLGLVPTGIFTKHSKPCVSKTAESFSFKAQLSPP